MAGSAPEREVLGVSDALARVQDSLDDLGPLWVSGEVFDYRGPHRSGHYYFKLKDADAVMEVKLWAGVARRALRADLEEGRKVLAQGRFDVYPPRGNLSFILDRVEDVGEGDLARKFELLKKRLLAEGLFDEAAKRPIPGLPRTVALITGHPSAAAADVLRTFEEHDAPFDLWLRPARVQGGDAAPDLVAAFAEVAKARPDVVLLARGGGSLEDLWAFNEEAVVRALRACPVPVISAIGHETDFTLCDFAADERAKTPTAGAARLVSGWETAGDELLALGQALEGAIVDALDQRRQGLDRLARDLRGQKPDLRLARMRQRLAEAHSRLLNAAEARQANERHRLVRQARRINQSQPSRRLAVLHSRLEGLQARLQAGSPTALLERGYALVEKSDGKQFLRSAAEAAVGDALRIRLAHGQLGARVESVEPDEDGGKGSSGKGQ